MRFQRCSNFDCGRPFQVNEYRSRKSEGSSPEEIICPHCGHKETLWTDSVFLVHAMSPEEEESFNADNPSQASSSEV